MRTGIGIAEEDQQKIFDEFYRVERDSKGKTPGTGLGFPLVRRFVELHGGRVWVGSDGEGKGSTFQFTIPVQKGEAVPVGDPRRSPRCSEGKRCNPVCGHAPGIRLRGSVSGRPGPILFLQKEKESRNYCVDLSMMLNGLIKSLKKDIANG